VTTLSIIVPCFDCADTLEEAVASIYDHSCPLAFDVTMVDDGSTDTTYAVMQRLAGRHSNIRLLRHPKNLGGGAARNTAARAGSGDIIFCLDADDLLTPGFLTNLTTCWLRDRCDGLGISESRKFIGRDIHHIRYVNRFDGVGQSIPFEALLDGSDCSLYSTFLITREAFEACGGYPTEHGFDTQGLAFRLLGNGLTARGCPDTVYLHRVEYRQSYFLREAAAGRVNRNWFLVYEEFLYLFNDAVKRRLLEHDLRQWPAGTDIEHLVRRKSNIYAPDYRDLIGLRRAGAAARFRDAHDGYLQYSAGLFDASVGDFEAALRHYARALVLGCAFPAVYWRVLQASWRLGHSEDGALELLATLRAWTQPPRPARSWTNALKGRVSRTPILGSLALSSWAALKRVGLRPGSSTPATEGADQATP
jgi:glycosyltransferase involved in cell wall biosynthesis